MGFYLRFYHVVRMQRPDPVFNQETIGRPWAARINSPSPWLRDARRFFDHLFTLAYHAGDARLHLGHHLTLRPLAPKFSTTPW